MTRYRMLCAVILVLFLAACGAAAESPAPAPTHGAGSPPTAGDAQNPPAGDAQNPGEGTNSPPADQNLDYYPRDEIPGLSDYIKKCQQLNRDIEEANVVYNAIEYMRRGHTHAVKAAITLRTEVPPTKILESKEAVSARVRVTCKVEAALQASEEEFDVQENGWRSRSLLTSPTARWTWSVTPKQGGNHELTLEFRPVIAMDDVVLDNARYPDLEGSTQTYMIATDVSVPLDQRVAEDLDRLTSVLTSAKGMVVSLSALVGALIALRFAIRRRRAKTPAGRA